MELIRDSLNGTTSATNTISKALVSSPVAIYFLGFLNFVSISSLYVLLNFKIPEKVYKYLSFIYKELGTSFLVTFNLDYSVPQMSD